MPQSRKAISLETIIGNICSHAQTIATERAAGILDSNKHPAAGNLRFHSVPGMEPAAVCIKPAHSSDSGKNEAGNSLGHVWDQCTVNGVHQGNRCGAISAFAQLCSSALVKWIAKVVTEHIQLDLEKASKHLEICNGEEHTPLQGQFLEAFIIKALEDK